MRLTRFYQLKESIRQLDNDEGIEGLAFRLQEEPFRVDPAELVIGQNGIYLVTINGAVSRVLLYDAEQLVDAQGNDKLLRNNLLNGGFDSEELLTSLPRYHFLNCKTIQQQSQNNWQENQAWQVSQRTSRRFIFRYVTESGILCDMDTQRLLACKHCTEELQEIGPAHKATAPELTQLAANSFHIRQQHKKPSGCSTIPKNLWADWEVISKHYSRITNNICKQNACNRAEAGKSEQTDYPQTHYVSEDKHHRQFNYINRLCESCHSQHPCYERVQRQGDVLQLNSTVKESQLSA